MVASSEPGPDPEDLHVPMTVIDEKDARKHPVLDLGRAIEVPLSPPSDSPYLSMDCGACGLTLTRAWTQNQLLHMVLRCPRCRAYNMSPPVAPAPTDSSW
jgi:hypothetical protein